MAKRNTETPQAPRKNLQDVLKEEFGKRTIENTELPNYFIQSLNPAMKLRPYQEECFKYFITYWENSFGGKDRQPQLLFHMATGSGKTLIMAGAMLYLFEKGYRNFLFFVPSTNIIEKTKENFLNQASPKYQFGPTIAIGEKRIELKMVDNFQGIDDGCINLCLETTHGLHSLLNNPKENSLTYDDFAQHKIVLISDEAHHMNSATKKGKDTQVTVDFGDELSDDWETTVMRIFNADNGTSSPNVLLEFTATADLSDGNIADKYHNKVIFDYPLRKFREDGYSKDIEVVQSDLSPIDRAIQTVVLSQYKRKLFAAIGQDIKPVMMLKSKTINENKTFFNLFIDTIKKLNTDDLTKIKNDSMGDIRESFKFLEEHNIDFDNLLLELKEDFKEENLLLVDGNNITAEKQLKLNSLEAKDNEFRAVFAVDMLNEGWDVLNLYDIVRLYETRDAKDGIPGKTTMQEAQLIGRGARYMPFTSPEGDKPTGQRKYDDDITNRLRTVEKLHYHSSQNPRYVSELQTAMEVTGIIAKKSKEINQKLKESFKQTELYRNGYIFVNEQEKYLLNENVNSFSESILRNPFKVRIKSGEMKSSLVFEKLSNSIDTDSLKTINIKMADLGNHIIRAAINRLETYKFSSLKDIFPSLKSIKDFIESENYLANLFITVSGREDVISDLSQINKLGIATEVLRQIEPMLSKSGIVIRGTKQFTPKSLRDKIKDKVLKVSLDGSDDKEYGKSMKESANIYLNADLSKQDWYAFVDCYGTSEEKYLVKYIEGLYPKLQTKYEEIYLVRNEREIRIYDFDSGDAFEPDFLLFMQQKADANKYDNIQIFIEPKGGHLAPNDIWKEKFMLRLKEEASITFSTHIGGYHIWGMPFYTEQNKIDFDRSFKREFEVQ